MTDRGAILMGAGDAPGHVECRMWRQFSDETAARVLGALGVKDALGLSFSEGMHQVELAHQAEEAELRRQEHMHQSQDMRSDDEKMQEHIQFATSKREALSEVRAFLAEYATDIEHDDL